MVTLKQLFIFLLLIAFKNFNCYALQHEDSISAIPTQVAKPPISHMENIANSNVLFESYRIEQLSKQLEYEKLNTTNLEKELQGKIDRINELNEDKKNLHSSYILAFIGIILITGFVIIFILKHYRKKIDEVRAEESFEFKKEVTRTKARQSLETIDLERERISRNLHDGISNSLVTLRLHLQSSNSEIVQRELLLKIVDNTHKEIRAIMHNLSTPAMENVKFEQLFFNYFEIINFKDSLRIEGILLPNMGWDTLDKKLLTELYRLIQEITGNIVKHSGATNVNVTLRREEEEIVLIAEDNGVGISTNQNSLGLGLKNLKTRVELLHGHLEFDSVPMQGTVIRVSLPVMQYNYN